MTTIAATAKTFSIFKSEPSGSLTISFHTKEQEHHYLLGVEPNMVDLLAQEIMDYRKTLK